ncbi:Eco57I restriction-modification methylase domain-containing protein [Flavobacterium ponti]|uniref:site-specific DNA-methyltransferase (adenine-specific) n=1 Tax=Flavobacterium ponti TaxID=665133 RepID=A0ABV9P198_9FLAO
MSKPYLQPRKALNKAFLKIKPNRTQIESFKRNLIQVLDSCNDKESEEFHKNLVSDFLKNTYYSPNHFVNTKGRNDLVIHNGKEAKSTVGVIIEAKSPTNKSEMISVNNLNGKALQELVLYFLRERITHKNLEIKHLVVTNIYEWFVFDAQVFDKLFAQNKSFIKQFEEFEAKQLSGIKTDFFYKDIAKPFIETIKETIEFTYFDFRTYDKQLRNDDKEDDKSLVALFKLLSPEHLLKLSFANDSNSLDKNFYSELLHIIGLTETKEGGKKLIQRPKKENRNAGSLLENAITQIDSLDKISRLPNPKIYGDTHEERLFNVALELSITWVNRILFLKLLEAQLISYHKGDKSYSFLNAELLHDYDNLNGLFFQVLAKKPEERMERVKKDYEKVPYLNSSLFEPTDLEHDTLFISNLEDEIALPLLSSTVIKDKQGKKVTGQKNALDYFFSFLDAYDFASEGSEDIQEDNKTLINASVLGLIFEKINGYKDGSFFTPGFITMYMCKETIRRAVVQKFNETKNWNCENFTDLYNKIDDKKEANVIVNSLKICDPAVGSGHFLVSALNELIVIKHDLKILLDQEGKTIRDYNIEIVNDELMITDEDNIPFTYNPSNKESQRIQETLFREKETLIENCLFGVDINPNSVKICRLRLWIELLKNAFYKENNELETLPNIDINIKCGNSLISRFDLDTDLKKALKQSKWNIESYKLAVATYRNAENKEQKREMERLIEDIKGNFRSEIAINDPKKLTLEKKKGELYNYTQQIGLFELGKKEKAEFNKRVNKLSDEVKTLESQIEEIKSNKIYENAFEWRFEFPEVLDDKGDFVGFDVVIGNPPYGVNINRKINPEYSNFYNEIILGELETYIVFYYRGLKLLKNEYFLSYITPDSWLTNNGAKLFREWLCEKDLIDVFDYYKPFADAKDTRCHSVLIKNSVVKDSDLRVQQVLPSNPNEIYRNFTVKNSSLKEFKENEWRLYLIPELRSLFKKIDDNSIALDEVYNIKYGLRTGDNNKYISSEITDYPIIAGADISSLYGIKWKEKYLKTIEGLPNSYFSESFTNKKIIIQYVRTNSLDLKARWIEAAYVEGNYIPLNSLSYIYSKNNDFELKYLIAVLNSYMINIYYRSYYTDVNVKPAYLSKIPIIKIGKKEQQPFIDKVDQILALKKANPEADTSVLEREIDFMVYALYGLSEEEIEIVEGS